MKDDLLQRAHAHPAGRVHLRGTVADAVACELLADGDEIVVGADPACDLAVLDPLLPPEAFRLRRIKCHAGTDEECRCHWLLRADPGARVYVNQHLTRRERLSYGDVVESGCHRFVFARADSASRNRRMHQNVADLCARLLASHEVPLGFIRNSPFYAYLRRRRRALAAAGLAAAALLTLFVLIPREELLQSVMPPLEVQVVDASMATPRIRSLESVERLAFQPAEPTPESPELAEKTVTPPPDQPARPRMPEVVRAEEPALAGKPVDLGAIQPLPPMATETPPETPVERAVARLEPAAAEPRRAVEQTELTVETARLTEYRPEATEVASARAIRSALAASRPEMPAASPDLRTWQLPVLPPAPVKPAEATVRRETGALTASALPVRRLSVSEAAQMAALASDTAALRVRTAIRPASEPVTRTAVRDVLAALQKPATATPQADPSAMLAQLAAYKASPVGFESFRGMQVPVVRITEQLEQLQTPGAAGPIILDGAVSPEEITGSWKSGRFHVHAPGQPPPEADPPTYCYVGKTQLDGKPCLYIAFTCVDPDVSRIVTRAGGGDSSGLIRDDSIEIFLDTNADRKDYYQLIVNAKGAYWSGYYPRPMIEGTIQTPSQPWNAGATVKTSITADPGQWVCEILVPFDRLGGVPAKGTRWAVNFARNYRGQIEDWQLQSWFAVYDQARNFHHPSLFGIFQW
ncbi:MAG: hypothetical protein FJ225_06265 [Lentisphaerae bacterium]|nr:hypothetical protein [Lentisphaerota bacterium]